jgi:hypothetical protein
MAWNENEMEELLRLVALTREEEIDCEECLARAAELAEASAGTEAGGASLSERLEAVRHHLSVCGECKEEFEALRQALEGLDPL